MNHKILSFNGKTPQIHNSAVIADNVVIIGDVIIEENVNIWPNATIRGDLGTIHIKKNTNIQDNSVIHIDYNLPCVIGENCIIGHSVILHSANIGNNCLVGMGSIVLNNAKMEDYSMLGAGSMLTSKVIIPTRQLWLGSPAKYFREVRESEVEYNKKSVEEYIELSRTMKNSNIEKL